MIPKPLKRLTTLVGQESVWFARRIMSSSRQEIGLPFDWSTCRHDRRAVVGLVAHVLGAERYLEIGCRDDELFKAVWCKYKVGVDPVGGGTIRKTSDAFFLTNDAKFDLIFVDGLHRYDQVLRDVDHSLSCLDENGVLILHDSLPLTWRAQHVPRLQRHWNGDVWRAAIELKTRPEIDLRVVLVDHGCAVIRKCPNTQRLPAADIQFRSLPFSYLVENHSKLGLLEFDELGEWLMNRPDPHCDARE